MNTTEIDFDKLSALYGTHSNVAALLGVTPRYYRGLRNGTFPISKRLRAHLCLLMDRPNFPLPEVTRR